jgi:hypothetical protein
VRTIILLLLLCSKCFSQDTSRLHFVSIDTIKLEGFTSDKVLVYKYHSVSFLFDFYQFQKELESLSKGQYHASVAKEALLKASQEIEHGDTAHFDQSTFDNISWVPLENFICSQLEQRKCLIVDGTNNIIRSIIRVHGQLKGERYFVWGGRRYHLPGVSKWFLECTEWES